MLGPSFDRSLMPGLTSRSGRGPLWVVWDTNVLSMYEQYGAAVWEGEEPEVRGHNPEEVAALGAVVTMWMWWDIRFVVLAQTALDSRHPRPPADVARRETSMRGIAAALELGLDGDAADAPPGRARGLPVEIAQTLPAGADRSLVAEAYRQGADVFLTTDKRVLRRDSLLAGEGLRLLPPSGLLDALIDAGIDPGWAPSQLAGLAPDLGRMAALLEALGV